MVADRHLYYVTVKYTTLHKRFLRKPSEENHWWNLGYVYGDYSYMLQRAEFDNPDLKDGILNAKYDWDWVNEPVLNTVINYSIADNEPTFELLYGHLRVEEFIQFCKDKALPIQVAIK